MKDAVGELNMTVVTVVAIAAVAAFFYAFIWPGIQNSIAKNTCANMCPGGAVKSASVKNNKCYCDDDAQTEIPINAEEE